MSYKQVAATSKHINKTKTSHYSHYSHYREPFPEEASNAEVQKQEAAAKAARCRSC
jgi:hypothetical protein